MEIRVLLFWIDIEEYVVFCIYGAGITSHVGPPGETQFYASGGLAMNMLNLVKTIQLRTAKRDGNGKLVEPLAELGFLYI